MCGWGKQEHTPCKIYNTVIGISNNMLLVRYIILSLGVGKNILLVRYFIPSLGVSKNMLLV